MVPSKHQQSKPFDDASLDKAQPLDYIQQEDQSIPILSPGTKYASPFHPREHQLQ